MSKKMKIALPQGGLLDAGAMGEAEDVPVAPHEPVLVPNAYGLTLVENKFAYRVGGDAGEKPKKSGSRGAAGAASIPPITASTSSGDGDPQGTDADDDGDHDGDDNPDEGAA